jgi:serine/threonine-protein kinase
VIVESGESGEQADPLIGAVVDGRYRIVRLIGRGGMGRVYEGERLGIGRAVAIKLLAPQGVPNANERARFAREATAAGKIDHPNCVGVSDFGMAPDGAPFLVMDLVVGRSLHDEIGRCGALPVPRALHIARHILRGLRHAHGLGLVHRDITPRNILLVERDGDPDFARVLDFGLAKAIEDQHGGDQITGTGFVCGTPRYMAPEQGNGKPADARSDLYALSVVLYEMIGGAPPFVADEPLRVLMMHVGAPVPPMDPAVPEAVAALVMQGLAKDPAERLQTADAYLNALAACMRAPARPAPARVDTHAATVPMARARTDDEPAAPRRSAARWWIAGAIAAAAIAATIAIAMVMRDDTPASAAGMVVDAGSRTGATRPPPAVDDPPDVALEDWQTALDRALAMIRARHLGSAERLLDELVAKHPTEGAIHLARGHLHNARNWPGPALKAYRAAIARDPALKTDADLLAAAISILDSTTRWWDAARFLERDVGPPAIPALEHAVATRNSIIKKRARAILAKLR